MKNKIVQLLTLVAIFIVAIIKIVSNAERIVLHRDFVWNITSYGSKYYIICLPIISVIVYMILLHYKENPFKINHIPKIDMTPKKQNLLIKYIQTVATLVLFILLYVTLCSAQFMALQPIIIILTLLIIIVYYIYTYSKLKEKE